MNDMRDDLYSKYSFGRVALRKIGPVPDNFRLYEAGFVDELPGSNRTMKVKGAEFREAKKGKDKGRLCIQIPGTIRWVLVTSEESQTEEARHQNLMQVMM